MKRLLVLFFVLFVGSLGFSQNEELDSLTIQLAYQNPDTSKVNTSISIIKLLYQNKDFSKASKFIQQSEKLANDLNYKEGLAKIIYYKAKIYQEEGRTTKAINTLKNTRLLFLQTNDTLSVAKVNSNLGVLEIENGNYKEGLAYALSSINELEKRNRFEDLSSIYKSLANTYKTSGFLDKAISYNLKRLNADNQTNNTKRLIETNKDLGDIYSIKKNYTQAISYYESALGYANSTDTTLRASILPYLGGAYLKKEDYKTSAKYLVEAIKLNREVGNKKEMAIALNALGELNLAQNRLQTAEEQLLEAAKIGKIANDNVTLMNNYRLMKTLDSIKGNFESAFVWQSEYHKLKEKLDSQKTKVTPLIIEEPDQEANQNTTLILDTKDSINSVSKDKFNKFKLIFYALLAAFAVVLTFFVLFLLKRNNKLKYTRELEAKNKKIELQNEAILEQSKHLENINKVKDKLFSIVSHDLKDSLTSTKGFIDLLKDGQLSQEEFHSLLPELSENANNASLLLFNLLNWSKSQMQSLEPKPSIFDIQEVFADKVKFIERKLEAKGIQLIDNTLRDFIYADRSMVEIVIQNLLANAVKFCDRGDSISISNQISNGKAIISVADTGVGIKKENIGKIFGNNTFTTRGTNKEKGTGLGLTICKELIELNKGNIWVESTVNVGSTFYVELPKNKVEDPGET